MAAGFDLIQRAIRTPTLPPETSPVAAAPAPVPADATTVAARAIPIRALLLAEVPPPTVGVLHVQPDGVQAFSITAYRSDAEPLTVFRGEMPRRRIQGAELSSAEVYDLMSWFSAEQRSLKQWLKNALAKFADSFTLIIADHTILGIPWEMFRLEKTKKEFLGARVATVRWDDNIFDDNDEEVLMLVQDDECVGDVVAYVDPEEGNKIAEDLAILDRLQPERHPDIFQLAQALATDRAGCGLVYLFCHGFVGKNVVPELGSKADKKKRLTLPRLQERSFHLLETSRSIVFLNACDSGRAVEERAYLCDHNRRSFSKLFLEKKARGVIATLDEVEVSHAGRIARELLQLIVESPATPVARLLRDLRARTLEGITENESLTEAQMASWFYTFLYVYYGNPGTVLRLTQGGTADG